MSSGRVLIDGVIDARHRQRVVALVDAPGVTEPEPALRVGAVVGEELAIARRKAWGSDVRGWLTRRGHRDLMDARFEKIDPELRLALLVELAASSTQVEMLILVMPDRHGVPASLIWEVATGAAADGLAVVVTVAATTGDQLPAQPSVMGSRVAAEPVAVAPIPSPSGLTEELAATLDESADAGVAAEPTTAAEPAEAATPDEAHSAHDGEDRS